MITPDMDQNSVEAEAAIKAVAIASSTGIAATAPNAMGPQTGLSASGNLARMEPAANIPSKIASASELARVNSTIVAPTPNKALAAPNNAAIENG